MRKLKLILLSLILLDISIAMIWTGNELSKFSNTLYHPSNDNNVPFLVILGALLILLSIGYVITKIFEKD